MQPRHPILQRYLAEDLIRRRRADEQQRYAAAQRQGRIDPNPHQIDAVIFALQRIPEGGCILADEVGLGKTIEAGLVIAQLLAEGKRRVLILAPKPLVGQWQNELYDHFGIVAQEGSGAGGVDGDGAGGGQDDALAGAGVFLVGREWAGGERGAAVIGAAEPFDLCVIDEAHEIFAGIHRRFDRRGNYRPDADVAVLAHRVREALAGCPKLLLTATPIQNSLAELWGLVQYIEPTGTLLGDLNTFRAVFTRGDDGSLFGSQAEELRRRLQSVVRRTLRRQAEEFIEKPFVRRQARLFEYSMNADERSLYDDVTGYLLEPNLCAFRGAARRLLLLGFHRRMASSMAAFAKSLENVAARLRALLDDEGAPVEGVLLEFRDDLEDQEVELRRQAPMPKAGRARVERELHRVERFVARAHGLEEDSKAAAMVRAVRSILQRGESGEGSGKLVVFTESLTTQDYLAELLVREVPLAPADVTLFRGTNASERAAQALAQWETEVGNALPARRRPAEGTAVRLALVHEFRNNSKVFISTEAGAKGLNLQFCETLVNYDLPWNPQRIEQRIGRCHRYGQTRDVTVVNFVAVDNAAQRLTFELLSRKLDLFGRVLDASDEVLHEPGDTAPETLGSAFCGEVENGLCRIYERARDIREIERELAQLAARIGAEREGYEAGLRRTRGVIQSRLDASVRRVFTRIHDDLPSALVAFDEDLLRLVTGYLDAVGAGFELQREDAAVRLRIFACDALPAEMAGGVGVVIGESEDACGDEVLHLAHPLVRAAIGHARSEGQTRLRVRFRLDAKAPPALRAAAGRRGRLIVTKLLFEGAETVERLVVTAMLEGRDEALAAVDAVALLGLPADDTGPSAAVVEVGDSALEDALEEGLFVERVQFAQDERERFAQRVHQIARSLDDQVLVLKRERKAAAKRLGRARDERDNAAGAAPRQRAERAMVEVEARLEVIDADLSRLAVGRDDRYQSTRHETLERRYAPVVAERILAAEFVLD